MSQTTNAGIVTAYGAAVRGGYQGTYNDFCTDLANLTQVVNELANLSATAETLVAGSAATATYSNGVFSFGIPRGDKGEAGDTGNGIESVSLLSTSGLNKTYRITFTDGTHFDYVVADGKSIVSTVLNVDYTLTITYNDGTTWTSESIRGATGATPNLTIGTVTTGAAGTPASAEIAGTAEDPVLNLTIPKGADGDVSPASLASTYSASQTYAVGDYVWYSGQLYCCTTAITTAEAWTAAHWTAAKLADDVKDLKSAFNKSVADNYSRSPLPISKNTADRAIGNNGGIVYSVGNRVVEYTVTPGDLIIATVEGRSSETYKKTYGFYNGDVSAAHLVGSPSESALSNSILIVPSGVTTFGICQASATSTDNVKHLSPRIDETDANLQDFEEIVFNTELAYIKTDGTDIADSIIKTNYYGTINGTTKIEMKPLNGYHVFLFPIIHDTYFYCDPTDSLFRICTIENGTLSESSGNYTVTGTNPTEINSGSFPTSNNKLLIPAGGYIIVCATTQNPCVINMSMNKLSTQILLDDRQVNQAKDAVVSEIGNSFLPMMLQYSASGNGCLNVYIPNADGYVKYEFLHEYNTEIYADVWRVDLVKHTDKSFVEDYSISTSGEWEVAIKIKNRDDFAGGGAHGDEQYTGITWIVDGKPVDITTFTTMTPFEELTIVQQSNLLDPDDHTTVFATHNSIHVFDKDGLIIRQSVVYAGSYTIATAYMAMLPIAQAVSNMLVPNSNYIPVSASNQRLYNVTDAVLYKTNGKVKARFYVTDFKFSQTNFNFMCVDNGGSSYNKCYFVNCLDDTAVTSGEIWKSETHYEFVTGS